MNSSIGEVEVTLNPVENREIMYNPTVESERSRHQAWGHEIYEVTMFSKRFHEYLCSCGIWLSAERFD